MYIKRFWVLLGITAISVGVGGCATEVPVASSPVTSPPDNHSAPAVKVANTFPLATRAYQLDQSLASLKKTKDEGNLTEDEYTRARAIATGSFCNEIQADEEHRQGMSSQTLHDELGYLAQMNKEKLLTDDEYQQIKVVVVNYYLSLGY